MSPQDEVIFIFLPSSVRDWEQPVGSETSVQMGFSFQSTVAGVHLNYGASELRGVLSWPTYALNNHPTSLQCGVWVLVGERSVDKKNP